MSGIGHNSDNVTAAELEQLITRVERLNEEIKGIQDDRKDVFTEAKSRGFDTAAMRRMISLRKLEKNARDERMAIDETYLAALGMI